MRVRVRVRVISRFVELVTIRLVLLLTIFGGFEFIVVATTRGDICDT